MYIENELIRTNSLTIELSQRIQIIKHKGVTVLYLDVSDMQNRTDDIIKLMNCHFEMTLNLKTDHVYHMVHGAGSKLNDQIKDHGKEIMKAYREYGIKVSSSILGITGIQRIIAKAIQPKFHFAKDMEDGLDWLAAQAK